MIIPEKEKSEMIKQRIQPQPNPDFVKIKFFCTRWGSEAIPWEVFLNQIKVAGYDGVEIGLPDNDKKAFELIDLIKNEGLLYIIQHWETNDKQFSIHRQEFEQRLIRLAQFEPTLLNSHTGKDFFTTDQNTELLYIAQRISHQMSVQLVHETHRGRFSFAAHVMEPYLKIANLGLALDVSHWFCVAESLLLDQQVNIDAVIPFVHHIHARIGHTQGPQVYDMFNDRWQETRNRHVKIWEQVIESRKRQGNEIVTITTEYGPEPYMPVTTEMNNKYWQFEQNVKLLHFLKAHFG